MSLVIEGPRGLLIVRRPDDDESLPGLWGLPATSLVAGEGEDEAVRRVGRQKLGVTVQPLDAIGEDRTDSDDQAVTMRDWAVTLEAGEPHVPQPFEGTQYTDLRWGEPADLLPAARAGSLCCRVLLRARDLDWER